MTIPPWLPRAKRLYEQGLSLAEVGRKLGGLHHDTVRLALKKAGVRIRSVAEAHRFWFMRAKKAEAGKTMKPRRGQQFDHRRMR